MVNQLLEAFFLGNVAILTNACLLPLYPGFVAFILGIDPQGLQRSTRWLGFFVLGGVLTLMILVGFILSLLNTSFGVLLPWFVPSTYIIVSAFGVLLLVGVNPFARLLVTKVPVLRNRRLSAYLYGLLLAPMTLPCTGPITLSAFLVGVANASVLTEGLLYFLVFGVGFGWPLVVLPLLTFSISKSATSWLTYRYAIFTRCTGVLLLAIGTYGVWSEVLTRT